MSVSGKKAFENLPPGSMYRIDCPACGMRQGVPCIEKRTALAYKNSHTERALAWMRHCDEHESFPKESCDACEAERAWAKRNPRDAVGEVLDRLLIVSFRGDEIPSVSLGAVIARAFRIPHGAAMWMARRKTRGLLSKFGWEEEKVPGRRLVYTVEDVAAGVTAVFRPSETVWARARTMHALRSSA